MILPRNMGYWIRGYTGLTALACCFAQTLPTGSPAERAAAMMDQAQKLEEQRTGAALQQAISLYREAIPLWRELHERAREGDALEQIGAVSLRMGNLPPALENLSAALAIFHELGDAKNEQLALTNLGLTQSRLGNQPLAIELQTRALELAMRVADRAEEAIIHNNLGLAYHEAGDERHAVEEFERAVTIQHDLGNFANEGAGLSNLGAIHYTQGDLQQSLDAFERALALRKRGGDRRGEANTMEKIAVLRHAFGQDDEAVAAFQAALKIDREVGDHLEEAVATSNLGNVYMAEGRYADAVRCFDEAIHLQEQWGKSKDWSNDMAGKGVALTDAGRYDEAASAFETALEAQRSIGNRRGQAETLTRQAALQLARGRAQDGAEKASEGARIAGEIGEKRSRAQALYQLARCQRALGRGPEALAAIGEAISLSETIRGGVADYDLRASYFSSIRDQYDLKINVLMQTGDVAGAFEAAEASRARSLLELIRNRLPESAAPESGVVSLEDIQKELDADTVALEYSLGRDASYVFILTSDSIHAIALAGRPRIETAARALYAKWSARQDSAVDCETISRLLITPVKASLGRNRIVVVPDGALAYIPFGALYGSPGHRLIEDRDVVSAVSLSTVKLLRNRTKSRPPAPKLIAIFADPVFTREDPRVRGTEANTSAANGAELQRSADDVGLGKLERLTSTRREAAAIAALAPEKLRWQAIDFDANRAAVVGGKLSDFRIVHFATHGLMNSRDPRLSGLVFSLVDRAGRTQEGFLRADDAFNLKLGADLVVLSACQTALGKELRGEGLLGLARAFMYAGAPRVLATLWRVADSATAELMTYFYEGLLKDRLPAADALRRAKLRLMRNPLHAAPYYWAGYTLQGDWR
jgi:CHAT domain-containing protein/Tfp pilus assembly protein PilF